MMAPKACSPTNKTADHFVSNPHFVAPTKADFAPGPLYPKRTVPYQYASLWDHPSFPRRTAPAPAAAGVGERVPRELRSRLKRSRGALALLEALEREVRDFLFSEPAEQPSPLEPDYSDLETDSLSCADGVTDSEEDEIVFVSRHERSGAGAVTVTAAAAPATAVAGLGRASEKVVFKSREEEQGANFGFVHPKRARGGAGVKEEGCRGEEEANHEGYRRWLVHSIAGYYGIKSWSVTEGRPAVRYAYVAKPPRGASAERVPPKPLYLMV